MCICVNVCVYVRVWGGSSSCLHSQQLQVETLGLKSRRLFRLPGDLTMALAFLSASTYFLAWVPAIASYLACFSQLGSWGQRAQANVQFSVSAQQGPEPASLLLLWSQFPPFVQETKQHFLLRERGLLHPHHPLSPQSKWGFRGTDNQQETATSA